MPTLPLPTRLSPLDLALVAIYLVAITLFGLGFREKGKDKSLKNYFLANNTIPWWAIALSIVSAETSTLTIISIPGVAFAGDFGFLQVVLGYMLGRVVVAFLFLPRYFRGEMLTAYQLIDRRFGPKLHKLTAGLFLITRAAAEGVRVFAISIVVGIAIGTGDTLSIAIISALTLLYTFEGGMAAVIWTDVVQMALYVAGTLVAIWTLGHHAGGWQHIHAVAAPLGKFHWLDFSFTLSKSYTFWAGVLGGTFLTMASHGTDQLMVQRLLAARNLRESRLALLSSGAVIFLQFTLFLLIGAGLFVFYDQHPQAFASNDRIFPSFIVQQMPHGVAGLLVAAILAAAMSNLSAALNSLASTTVIDFYVPWKNRVPQVSTLRPGSEPPQHSKDTTAPSEARPPSPPEPHSPGAPFMSQPHRDMSGTTNTPEPPDTTNISRLATLFWALVLFAIAVYSIHAGQHGHVVEIALSIASVAYGCLLGVFLLGTLTRYATQTGTIIGMIVGFLTNLLLWQFPQSDIIFNPGPHQFRLAMPQIAFTWYVLIGSLMTFAVGTLFSLILPRNRLRKATATLLLCLVFLLSFRSEAQEPAVRTTTHPGAPPLASERWVPTPPRKLGAPFMRSHRMSGTTNPDFTPITTLLNQAIADHKLPGAVVLIGHNGKVVFHQAYGLRKLAGEPGLNGVPTPAEPMTEDTLFDMASLTKVMVTTTAILQLYEQHKLDLDAPVSRYLPAFTTTTGTPKTANVVPVEAAGFSPLNNLPSKERLQARNTPNKEELQPRDSPIKEGLQPRNAPTKEELQPRDTPIKEGLQPRDTPIKEGLQPRDTPIKEGLQPRNAPNKEGLQPRDTPTPALPKGQRPDLYQPGAKPQEPPTPTPQSAVSAAHKSSGAPQTLAPPPLPNPQATLYKSQITIRQLLTHYSGLPEDISLKDPWGLAQPDKAEGIRRALAAVPYGPPGITFKYSDINFITLGYLVEKLSHKDLDEYAQDFIFKPLAMHSTAYHPFSKVCLDAPHSGSAIEYTPLKVFDYPCEPYTWVPSSSIPSTAPTAHDNEGTLTTNPNFDHLLRGTVHDPTTRRMGGVAGHAGLFSTAADAALFCQALLDKLTRNQGPFPLKQSTLQMALRPQAPATAVSTATIFTPDGQPTKGVAQRALGWDLNSAFSRPRGEIFPITTATHPGSFGHTGFTGTSLWLDPTTNSYVILLANAIHPRGNPPISALRGQLATAAAKALGLTSRMSASPSSPAPAFLLSSRSQAKGPTLLLSSRSQAEGPAFLLSSRSEAEGPAFLLSSRSEAKGPAFLLSSRSEAKGPAVSTTSASGAHSEPQGQRPDSYQPGVQPQVPTPTQDQRAVSPAYNSPPSAATHFPPYDPTHPCALPIICDTFGAPKSTPTHPPTQTGIDVLESTHYAALLTLGKPHLRIALLTNQSGLDSQGRRTIDLLLHADPQIELVKLFTPEHGLLGKQDTESLKKEEDPTTHLPVISLYGAKPADRHPKPSDLKNIDAVVIDLQDAGVRFWTYTSVLGYFLEAAAKARIEVVVLDRPNPVGGIAYGGPGSDPGTESYVNFMPTPVRHGMTFGELARFYNANAKQVDLDPQLLDARAVSIGTPTTESRPPAINPGLGASLTVVKMQNWSRADFYEDTGVPWTPPSPNLRTPRAAILYPAIGLTETTNISVGRGTQTPFENIAAPFLDSRQLADYLSARQIPGIAVTPTTLTIAETPEHYPSHGQTIPGIHFEVTDPQVFDSPEFGIELLSALHRLYPQQFQLEKARTLLCNPQVLAALKANRDPRDIAQTWQSTLKLFTTQRAASLLY